MNPTSSTQLGHPITSIIDVWKESFSIGDNGINNWKVSSTNPAVMSYGIGGNSSSSDYLRVGILPTSSPNDEIILTSNRLFKPPFRLNFGVSLSQRIVGEELAVEMVGVDQDGNVEKNAVIPLIPISGTVTIATNVATINFATPHPFFGGDRVAIYGNAESRLNVGPVVVTVVSKTQITVPCTLTNGTYTAGGYVYLADPFSYASNASSYLFENATATNASVVCRANGNSFRTVTGTIATTAGTQANVNPYTDAWIAATELEMTGSEEELLYLSRVTDNTATAPTIVQRYNRDLININKEYAVRIRMKRLPNYSGVVGTSISSIAKSGTTTATVITSTPHGLTTGNFVQIYGVLDQTNFANLVTAAAITVVDAVTFTVVLGSAVTATSSGGVVVLNNGSVTLPGAINLAIASIARTNQIITVTMNTTASGMLPGEWLYIGGMTGAAAAYIGAYKVLRMTGSTYELESSGADFASIATGGAAIKMTDFRVHYVKVLDYAKTMIEFAGARGPIDAQRAMSAVIASGTITTVSTVTTVASITSANLGLPLTVADQASAAITTTTTSAAITPASGPCYQVNIPVTAVTGTNPTMDVQIQESDDAGTNWFAVYDFPRITASGMYRSPLLKLIGNRVRYVQTLTGTTPSFTRSINRLQSNATMDNPYRQIIDRSVVLTTLSSTTPSLEVKGCMNFMLVINVGAITTTAPALQLQASEDNGTTWVSLGTPLTAVASSTVQTVVAGPPTGLLRAIVTTAGVGVTAGYVLVKGY